MANAVVLLDHRGDPIRSAPKAAPRPIRLGARYDAAATNSENKNHWANADSLSAREANSPEVRAKLRNRSRYECDNNGYAGGLVGTLAEDLVGTGPRLQLSIPGADPVDVAAIEASWRLWCADPAVALADQLSLLEESSRRDGEGFALHVTNDAVKHPVTLALKLLDAEQCATPTLSAPTRDAVDGITFDGAGNPRAYHFLREHPGDTSSFGGMAWGAEFDAYPASRVIHWFRRRRAGQARGVPEIMAGLPLYAQLRRYTLAVLGAAELAASIAGVMETDSSAEEGPVLAEAFDEIEIVRQMLLTLPAGWKAKTFESAQPTTGYPDFKRELLNEAGRCVNAPLNVVTGNSSGYNFSSGRLDHVPYHRGLWIRRQRMETTALNPLFLAWLSEYRLIPQSDGGPPPVAAPASEWGLTWNWDGFDSIDPSKDAKTDDAELRNHTTTLSEVCARKGTNWRDVLTQRAAEIAMAKELGLPAATASTAPVGTPRAVPDDEEGADDA